MFFLARQFIAFMLEMLKSNFVKYSVGKDKCLDKYKSAVDFISSITHIVKRTSFPLKIVVGEPIIQMGYDISVALQEYYNKEDEFFYMPSKVDLNARLRVAKDLGILKDKDYARIILLVDNIYKDL